VARWGSLSFPTFGNPGLFAKSAVKNTPTLEMSVFFSPRSGSSGQKVSRAISTYSDRVNEPFLAVTIFCKNYLSLRFQCGLSFQPLEIDLIEGLP